MPLGDESFRRRRHPARSRANRLARRLSLEPLEDRRLLAAGLELLKDVNPSGSNSSSPVGFFEANSTLYFSATSTSHGIELWRTDGTAAGTVRVKDINPGSASSSPGDFVNLGGIVYFAAHDGSSGRELWKTDGTEAGTLRVADINAGSGDSTPQLWGTLGGQLFSARSMAPTAMNCGSATAPRRARRSCLTIRAGPLNSSIGSSGDEYNGELFFMANDGATGYELWKTDGTAAGTVIVKDINPGIANSLPRYSGKRRRLSLFFRQRRHNGRRTMEKRRHDRGNDSACRHVVPAR